jgi:hypothetical protein
MTTKSAVCFVALFLVFSSRGGDGGLPSGLSPTITPPTFNAKLTVGFNYDILRPPTDVSFDYAKGYAAFNFPFESGSLVPKETGNDLWGQISDQLSQDPSQGQSFQPQASARQFANTTIRVDIPMLGGVASFSNIQNVYINYLNTLGNTDLRLGYDTTIDNNGTKMDVSLLLLGAVNVPVEASLGWETMSFGYAYRVNKDLVLAANVQRHIFRLDLLAKVDVDMLGQFSVSQSGGSGSSGTGGLGGTPNLPNQSIDYPSSKVYGEANGHFEAEAWSASFGIKYWRFTLTSRFGVDTKARGSLVAKYYLPFFIDARTFQPSLDIQDASKLLTMMDDFQQQKTDSVVYFSADDARWKLPQGHTIAFDLIRDKVSLSYTKIFGDIQAYHSTSAHDSTDPDKKRVDLDAAITIDNIIMLNCNFYSAFFNLGVFGLDMRINNDKNIIGNAIKKTKSISWMRLGDNAMLPILNLGAMLGSKTQLGFELDVLPLPAFKTGVVYHF